MSGNVTFLGDVADGFDRELDQAEKGLDEWVESSRYSKTSMASASTAIAFMRFGQTFVDVLRIGNGLREGTFRGVGSDAMRLLTVVGIAGAGISRLSRVLVVTQQAETFNCSWITAVNAARRVGQRFFGSLDEFAKAAGVDLAALAETGGTDAAQFAKLVEGMKKIGLAVEEVRPPSDSVEAIADVLKARPSGALGFAIKYESGGRTLGHQLFATYSKTDGLVITDTTATIFRGAKVLSKVYKDAKLLPSHMFFLKNAAILELAQGAATGGGVGHLVVELLPLALKKRMPARGASQRR